MTPRFALYGLMSTDMPPSKEPDSSDTEAKYVKCTRIGVWEFYEDKEGGAVVRHPLYVLIQIADEILTSFPYFIRGVDTLRSICFDALMLYLATSLVQALLPAISLYCSSQLLEVVQESIDSRTVDKTLLFSVLGCTFACAVVGRIVAIEKEHFLRAEVRLDVPTFEDPAVRYPLRRATARPIGTNRVWDGIMSIIEIFVTIVQLVSQLLVLLRVLRDQPDDIFLALLCFAEPVLRWFKRHSVLHSEAWAATCRNLDYVRIEGFRSLVKTAKYRKEIVAGNLQGYAVSEYRRAHKAVKADDDVSFEQARYLLNSPPDTYSFWFLLDNFFREIPQVFFTLHAVKSPRSIPVSLASLTLIRQAAASFADPLETLFYKTSSMSQTFTKIRDLYELINLKNQVTDGTEPYPEQTQTVQAGITIEFKDVSFKYPSKDKFAIRNVTFKIGPGQLCVLVGFNGSGKSTILKLLTRLYDPTEGTILIDGRDIKTLKLADLRRCIAVLFQDYTHFPLSIKENIGMGNPEHATDEDMIRQAAALGGATEIIEGLPEGFDTFLSRPVPDQYSSRLAGTQSLFGGKVDYSLVKQKMGERQNIKLSGGQMQRLAVSRTFMRSLGSDSRVGLLLFDEPSASLDPEAEHDLFERLRRLRGSKTMVFSSHRFGQLTRTADKILYMANSTVLELGTHEELLKLGGGYSKMYNIQAAQFQ